MRPAELGREHVGAEGGEALGRGEAEVALAVGPAGGQAEQVLVAAQRRVVVVRAGGVGRAGHDVLRVQQQGADLAAAGRLAVRRCRRRCPVRACSGPDCLVAAGRRRVGAADVGLVERDDDEHVAVLVGGRVEDERHPGPQELVRPGQAAHVGRRCCWARRRCRRGRRCTGWA